MSKPTKAEPVAAPETSEEAIAYRIELTETQHSTLWVLILDEAAKQESARNARKSIFNPGSAEPELGSVYRSVLAIKAKLEAGVRDAE